jgi:hypothetical protein
MKMMCRYLFLFLMSYMYMYIYSQEWLFHSPSTGGGQLEPDLELEDGDENESCMESDDIGNLMAKISSGPSGAPKTSFWKDSGIEELRAKARPEPPAMDKKQLNTVPV